MTIICDASHDYETKSGGYGYWIVCNRGNLSGGRGMKGEIPNSTIAELIAVINSVAIGMAGNLIQENDSVLIQVDCLAVISVLEGSRKPSHIFELRVVEVFKRYVKDYNLRIELRHVKGHTSIRDARSLTNRQCDIRAKRAMRLLREQRLAKPYIDQIRKVLNEPVHNQSP